MRVEQLLVVLLLVVITGCAAPVGSRARPDPTGPATRTGTVVSMSGEGDCLFAEDPRRDADKGEIAILGSVLASVISQAVNRLGTALAESAKAKTWHQAGSANLEIGTGPQGVPACFVVMRGDFYLSKPPGYTSEWAAVLPANLRQAAAARLDVGHGVWPKGTPDFFLEGWLRPSSDGSALAFRPTAVAFEQALGSRALRGDSTRQVLVNFVFHEPGKPADASGNPSAELVLGRMTPGDRWVFPLPAPGGAGADEEPPPEGAGDGDATQEQGAAGESARATAPAPGPEEQPAGDSESVTGLAQGGDGPAGARADRSATGFQAGELFETRWIKLPRTEASKPWTLTVTPFETQDESDFLAFVAAVFAGSQKDIESALQTALVPEKREAARLAALQARFKLEDAADQALSQAIASLDACANDPDSADRAAIRKLQRAANLTAAAADRPIAFAEGAIVPILGNPAAAARSCGRALAGLH